MYDIKPLEEQWRQYKRNKKKPFIIGSIILLAFSGISLFIWQYKHVYFSKFSFFKKTEIATHLEKKDTKVFIDKSISTLQIHKKKIIKKPQYVRKPNVQSVKVDSAPTLPVVNDIPIFNTPSVQNKIVVSEAPKIKIVEKDMPHKKMHMNIVDSSMVSAYKDVEKRFYQSHDTDDSLFLAKSYYRKGNYEKSQYWSLQTNKINSSIEESWLIFIKSKIKLGYKNQAISILTNYVKKSNSYTARNLLLKLKK